MTPRREAVAAWRRELGGRALTALAQATPTWRLGVGMARGGRVHTCFHGSLAAP